MHTISQKTDFIAHSYPKYLSVQGLHQRALLIKSLRSAKASKSTTSAQSSRWICLLLANKHLKWKLSSHSQVNFQIKLHSTGFLCLLQLIFIIVLSFFPLICCSGDCGLSGVICRDAQGHL